MVNRDRLERWSVDEKALDLTLASAIKNQMELLQVVNVPPAKSTGPGPVVAKARIDAATQAKNLGTPYPAPSFHFSFISDFVDPDTLCRSGSRHGLSALNRKGVKKTL